MNIVLTGIRGIGKSTIARRLALLTHRQVVSTDLLISYDNGGRSIPQILADHQGDWRLFRQLEFQVIQKVSRLDNLIIDTGGGVVVDLDEQGQEIYSHRKVAALKHNGFILWLKGDPVTAAKRVQRDSNRPDLDVKRSEVEIMQRRQPFYQQAADLVVVMEDCPPRDQANKIYQSLLFHQLLQQETRS
ncbi:MAG: shikimate kinase [Magnetococcales bacterium]|nr:shikimate kinase [Magnetococcales bacterium]NGZ27961.1 shikimate kinase [Magnetococcales bacterium]